LMHLLPLPIDTAWPEGYGTSDRIGGFRGWEPDKQG
jgi:hypothetical protein